MFFIININVGNLVKKIEYEKVADFLSFPMVYH
jgi:hypothetical protein